MTNNKIKFYKNPTRATTIVKPYVPQYKTMGLEPSAYFKNNDIIGPVPSNQTNNQQMSRSNVQVPYAEAVSSPVGRGRGLLPNVGNNVEQTWSSVDGNLIDDLHLDQDQVMIDNNELVSDQSLGIEEKHLPQTSSLKEETFISANGDQSNLDISNILQDLEEENYLLLVTGSPVCCGILSDIENQVKDLVFGEHPLCNENSISIDDIVVLKRIKIKIGVFLE